MDAQKIIKEYINGKSLNQLSKENKIYPNKIKKILLENDIKIRTRKESIILENQKRTKKINHNYFSQENSNMAYLLGFYAADGTVRRDCNEIKLTLCSIDRDFLEQIRKELQSEREIKTYRDGKGYENSSFVFSSAQIKEDFKKYGIISNKTYNFKFPVNLNKEYWIDFIRGYFDGDGTICKSGKYLRWELCSHEREVLEKIIDFFFERYNIPKINIHQRKDGLYYFQYSQNATKQIYNILYTKNSLFLPRKKEKFDTLINII